MIRRLVRDTAVTCGVMAVVAAVWFRDARVAGGVLAGGVLVGVALWALAGVVNALTIRGEDGEFRPISRPLVLVKFFTRHVILALVAYVMMVRLHLDPVGMVVGVTSVVAAALIAALRPR